MSLHELKPPNSVSTHAPPACTLPPLTDFSGFCTWHFGSCAPLLCAFLYPGHHLYAIHSAGSWKLKINKTQIFSSPGVCACVYSLSDISLCEPRDYNLPGCSVHGPFPARRPEWVAFSTLYSKWPGSQVRAQLGSHHCLHAQRRCLLNRGEQSYLRSELSFPGEAASSTLTHPAQGVICTTAHGRHLVKAAE